MNLFQVILLVYLILIAIGGIMGYTMAQSTISLVMGLVSALLLGIALWLSFSNPKLGFGIATVIALALGIFFTMRYMETGKMMPGGITMILSAITLIAMLVALVRKA